VNEVLFRHLPVGTEETQEIYQSEYAGVPAEIRTKHLANTNLERCRYTSLLEAVAASLP
jgi:hypothetical protein